MKNNVLQKRFLCETNAPQAKLMKENMVKARFFD